MGAARVDAVMLPSCEGLCASRICGFARCLSSSAATDALPRDEPYGNSSAAAAVLGSAGVR